MTVRLVVMGGGRMGEALVSGLLRAGWAPAAEMVVVEKQADRRRQLQGLLPGVLVAGDVPPAAGAAADGTAAGDGTASGAASGAGSGAGAVVAVKPDDVEEACRQLASAGIERLLSIAAGVRLASLQAWVGEHVRVVRAMPNTPALVGEGAAGISAGTGAGPDDLDWAEGLLSAVGTVVRVPEPLLDAVTGLSGSGPAYVYLVAEALIDAGVLAGLARETSTALVVQTLLGSARMLAESGQGPEALRAAVTSPGGTTAEGLRTLEERAVRAAFIDAVKAATDRARTLGT